MSGSLCHAVRSKLFKSAGHWFCTSGLSAPCEQDQPTSTDTSRRQDKIDKAEKKT